MANLPVPLLAMLLAMLLAHKIFAPSAARRLAQAIAFAAAAVISCHSDPPITKAIKQLREMASSSAKPMATGARPTEARKSLALGR